MSEDSGRSDPVAAMAEEAFGELKQEGQPAGQAEKEKKGMLPTKKTPPKVALSDQTILIYGRPKIGKSSFCANAPGALFLATEAGLNWLEVFQAPIKTWQEFLMTCKEISEGNHGFKTIVVDTVDNALKMCSVYIRAKFKIDHESDLGYGKGFSLVYDEFYRVLNKLSLLPSGLFLVSHSEDKEIEVDGVTRVRSVPTLPGKARWRVLGMADIILYCDLEVTSDAEGKRVERRVIRTAPSEKYAAGGKMSHLPATIDLNYGEFVAAFERKAVKEEAPLSKPEKKQFATDAQVKEFEELTSMLGIAPDVVKQRLAQFGAEEPYGVEQEPMGKILAKLRAARAAKAGEAKQEE